MTELIIILTRYVEDTRISSHEEEITVSVSVPRDFKVKEVKMK